MKNITWQPLLASKLERAKHLHQIPLCIWLTGLSGSGKSTIASGLEAALLTAGKHGYVLDGDNLRHGLNQDLGFSLADRKENIRRVAEVARLMLDAGLVVIVSFISPLSSDRDAARAMFDQGEFVEVFVDASLEACEQRDTKGLYAKARSGLIKEFTGIDSPYEVPPNPDLHIDTMKLSVEDSIKRVFEFVMPRI